jgi:hypothetical protein
MPEPADPRPTPSISTGAAKPSDPPVELELLVRLARALVTDPPEEDGADRPTDGVLVAIAAPLVGPDPGGGSPPIDLLFRELDGHPVEGLTGFTAPPGWSTLGVVCSGTARHLVGSTGTDAGSAPPPLGDRQPIRVAYLVARSGVSASACRRPDGTIWSHSAAGLDDAGVGRVDDVLRRALRLPTHPPHSSSIELWARLWLDRAVEEVAARPRRRWTWPAIARLHPAAQLVLEDLPERGAEVADSILRLGEMLGRSRSWSELRIGHSSAVPDPAAIRPDLAEWMDDGIFSRWLLDGVPDCGSSLVHLRDLLPPGVIGRIERVLDHWEVDIDLGNDPWLSSPCEERS